MSDQSKYRGQELLTSIIVFGASVLFFALSIFLFVSQRDLPPLSAYSESARVGETVGIDVDKILEFLRLPADIKLSEPRFSNRIKPDIAPGFAIPRPRSTAILIDRNLIARKQSDHDLGADADLVVPPPPPLFPEDFVALEFIELEELGLNGEILPSDPGLVFLGVLRANNDGPLKILIKDLRSDEIVQLGANDRYGDLEVTSVDYHSALFRLPDGRSRRLTTRKVEARFLPRTIVGQSVDSMTDDS